MLPRGHVDSAPRSRTRWPAAPAADDSRGLEDPALAAEAAITPRRCAARERRNVGNVCVRPSPSARPGPPPFGGVLPRGSRVAARVRVFGWVGAVGALALALPVIAEPELGAYVVPTYRCTLRAQGGRAA